MTYDLLLDETIGNRLVVKEKTLRGSDGRICDYRIAIRKGIDTSNRKICILSASKDLGAKAIVNTFYLQFLIFINGIIHIMVCSG